MENDEVCAMVQEALAKHEAEEQKHFENLFSNLMDRLEDHIKENMAAHEVLTTGLTHMRSEMGQYINTAEKQVEDLSKTLVDIEKRVISGESVDAMVKELKQNWNDYLRSQGLSARHLRISNGGKGGE